MAQTLSLTASSNGQDMTFRFSEIASILKGRLTDTEINDLLVGLLSQSIVEVHPGDLITAEWAMSVVRRLERLELVGVQTLPINNKALSCLQDTISAYGGLLTQGVFIPSEGSNVPLKAILQMTAALQRVILFSITGMNVTAMADDSALVNVFQHLYDTQKDLVSLLSSSLLGATSFDQRSLFAKLLKFQLDEDQGNGVMSLRTALNQKDLNAAIAAQNRINGISMEQSGDVTLGNLQVIYQGSNDGESLKVPDTVSYTFNYRVYNKTNRKVDVQISVGFRQLPAWNDFAQISGAKLLRDLTPFDLSNPSDTKAYRDVEVVVQTPKDAKVGEVYFLELTAQIPGPISLGDSDFVKLKGDTQRRSPTVNWVRFENVPFLVAGQPTGAVQDEQVSYRFSYAFHATTGQTTRKFRVIVDITSVASEATLFDIDMSAGQSGPVPVLDRTNSISTKWVSQPFDLVSDQPGSFQIDVWPAAGSAGKTLSYSASLESIDGALKPDPVQTASIKAI